MRLPDLARQDDFRWSTAIAHVALCLKIGPIEAVALIEAVEPVGLVEPVGAIRLNSWAGSADPNPSAEPIVKRPLLYRWTFRHPAFHWMQDCCHPHRPTPVASQRCYRNFDSCRVFR